MLSLYVIGLYNWLYINGYDNRSQKFAKDSQTAQFVEMRTKKCLQNFRGQLELGLCNQKSTQQWQFEFYNQALI